jgi:peptidoglycan/LPS O-acetylase OafA/YrhL
MIKTDNKLPVLYLLRAIAALSVCFYHFVCSYGLINNQSAIKVFAYGAYGVDMFFVISGFIIPWSMYYSGYKFRNFFQFLFKRLARLEPPYIASMILAIVASVLAQQYVMHSSHITLNPVQIALHFGYLIPFFKHYHWLVGVYWTLAIEFQYYLLMALTFSLVLRSNLWGRICFYAAIMGFTLIMDRIEFGRIMPMGIVAWSNFLPHYLPIFLVGILLFLKKSDRISMKEYACVTLSLFIYCILIYGYGRMICIFTPVFFILFFQDLKFRALSFFGEISYSIYLMHDIAGNLFINLVTPHASSHAIKVLVIVGAFAVSTISAYLLYILIERPSKRFSGNIKYKTSA